MDVLNKIRKLKRDPLVSKRLSQNVLDNIEKIRIDDELTFDELRTLYIVVTNNCLPGVIYWVRENNFDRTIKRTPRELIELLKQTGVEMYYLEFESWFLKK